MRVIICWSILFCGSAGLFGQTAPVQTGSLTERYGGVADRIIRRAMEDSIAYRRLSEMCDRFGPRFSGTPNLERAIDWVIAKMTSEDAFDNAHTEPVMVPHWVRGAESCELITPRHQNMALLGLGGSVGTPPEGITARMLVVHSFDELQRLGPNAAKDRIVLFNAKFTNYGETIRYRLNGAVEASRAGAVACLVRSVTPYSLYTPHTGMMSYNDTVSKIPAAAITPEDADMIERMMNLRYIDLTVRLKMEAKMLPDTQSRNLMAQITGSEKPEEILVFGGHIDSWDVGSGALDDGGGCVAAWQALKVLRLLGLRPRRTIRVVMWTNEENGIRGAQEYARIHANERHVLALETDGGVFAPTGFGYGGTDSAGFSAVTQVASMLRGIGADTVVHGGGGADIGPLAAKGVPGMELRVEASRYFWFHHTNADTPDKLNPREINMCAAAMAVMMYVMADR